MGVAYPAGLRAMITAEKTRSQPARFAMLRPRRGMPYAERNGTTPPEFFDCTFRFTACEAVAFRMWFEVDLDRGRLEADIPISTEAGVVTRTGRFLPESLLDTTENGEVWEYRATFMSSAS